MSSRHPGVGLSGRSGPPSSNGADSCAPEGRKLSAVSQTRSDALCKLCSPSPELRILLLCGSDLLESFCIPGLWNEADVSSLCVYGWRGWGREGGRGIFDLGFGLPSPSTDRNLASPEFPRGQFIHMTMEENSHLSQALSPYHLFIHTPLPRPWEALGKKRSGL